MMKEAYIYFWSCATVRSGFGNESRASGSVGRASSIVDPEAFPCRVSGLSSLSVGRPLGEPHEPLRAGALENFLE